MTFQELLLKNRNCGYVSIWLEIAYDTRIRCLVIENRIYVFYFLVQCILLFKSLYFKYLSAIFYFKDITSVYFI